MLRIVHKDFKDLFFLEVMLRIVQKELQGFSVVFFVLSYSLREEILSLHMEQSSYGSYINA
jgi:hypothetical protein